MQRDVAATSVEPPRSVPGRTSECTSCPSAQQPAHEVRADEPAAPVTSARATRRQRGLDRSSVEEALVVERLEVRAGARRDLVALRVA